MFVLNLMARDCSAMVRFRAGEGSFMHSTKCKPDAVVFLNQHVKERPPGRRIFNAGDDENGSFCQLPTANCQLTTDLRTVN